MAMRLLGHHQMMLPPSWGLGTGSRRVVAATAVAISNAETRERQRLMIMFQDAFNRCLTHPTHGLSFSPDDFLAAIGNYHFTSHIGSKVKGTVFMTDGHGAYVDIPAAKSGALLPVEEASLYSVKRVEEAGIVAGVREEFVIVGQLEEDDDMFVVSLKSIQQNLAWERCRQLQAEDVTLNGKVREGKVVDGNKGGIVVTVEGLSGFVPFSQISSQRVNMEELIGKEIPLKFVEVDEEESRLVLSNRKAMADSQSQLGIGSVVIGTVQSLKPYGAFIDIGGVNGLLHVSQVSHDPVADISTVLQAGDTLKVMILSHDRERGRVSVSTKKLEPTPGDMIKNPTLVFDKAEEMAQAFRQRIAEAEAMARADMLRFQPESGVTLTPEGILDPVGSNLPAESLNLSDVLPDLFN